MATVTQVQPKPIRRTSEKQAGILLALPAIVWMALFFVLPLIIVLNMSFLTTIRGGGEQPYTIDSYDDVFNGFYEAEEIQEGFAQLRASESFTESREIVGKIIQADNPYSRVIIRSLGIALATTVICLLVGYPLAYFIGTRRSSAMRSFTLFMVILPFWTNFLVRTYAWRVMLGDEGVINNVLIWAGLIQEPISMLFTRGAVLVGLVYGFLPFMVLPIYASVERFNFRLVEAANDLGANDWSAFWRVILPGTLPGVIAGCILVFIPSIGSYITPELLGGTKGLMIGNLIASSFKGTGNWPRGSALSIILMVLVLLSLIIYTFNNRGESAAEA